MGPVMPSAADSHSPSANNVTMVKKSVSAVEMVEQATAQPFSCIQKAPTALDRAALHSHTVLCVLGSQSRCTVTLHCHHCVTLHCHDTLHWLHCTLSLSPGCSCPLHCSSCPKQ